MSWLGTIRPTTANDDFDTALWLSSCKRHCQCFGLWTDDK
jgi:hypothetical protein